MKNNYTFLELFGDIDEKFIYDIMLLLPVRGS